MSTRTADSRAARSRLRCVAQAYLPISHRLHRCATCGFQTLDPPVPYGADVPAQPSMQGPLLAARRGRSPVITIGGTMFASGRLPPVQSSFPTRGSRPWAIPLPLLPTASVKQDHAWLAEPHPPIFCKCMLAPMINGIALPCL